MKKDKLYIYRIKDLSTGLYFNKRYTIVGTKTPYEEEYKRVANYSYITKNRYGVELETCLFMDIKGNFYPTKKGAERIASEFTATSTSNRKTPAGRILNSRFNFVVVKTEVKLKDITE